MAREEARIFTTIWDDPEFIALTPEQQRLYFFLLSQPDLSYCGVIALRERRWSSKAAGLTPASIEADLAALARNPSANPSGNPSPNPSANPPADPSPNPPPGPLVLVDEDTEEVFTRTLIRHDGIWKIPNLLKAAREAARLIQSPRIRAALLAELYRLPLHESDSVHVRKVLAGFIADLGGTPPNPWPNPSANPSSNPPRNPSANPSGNPSPNPSQGKGVRGKGKDFPSVDTEGLFFTSEADASDGGEAPPGDSPDTQPGPPPRDDVERLCAHLADRIESNGSKRPTITKKWRDAARLMIDKDGRTEEQIHIAIGWCQDDEFWRSNVMSMPKLRDKYDQLRLQASRSRSRKPRTPATSQDVSPAMARAIALEEQMRRAGTLPKGELPQ